MLSPSVPAHVGASSVSESPLDWGEEEVSGAMATNIEQIFRSFVVNKFKEIQEEGKLTR